MTELLDTISPRLLVLVVGLEERDGAGLGGLGAVILALGGEAVDGGALAELQLRGPDILRLAAPRLQGRGLQGPAEAEGQPPGLRGSVEGVDGVQVDRRLLQEEEILF